MKSGEYRLTEPGTNEAISHRLGSLHRGAYDFLAAHDGDPSTNPGDLSPKAPSGLTAEQQRSLIEGTEGATARVARIKAESDALVDSARKDPNHQYHTLFQKVPVVLEDDIDAGDSEYRRMAQQYGDADLRNAILNQAGKGVSLADYYGAQRQLGEVVSGDSDNGEAMVQHFMARPGFDTREKAEAFIKANPAIAFRDFNRSNPMAMVGDKPAMVEQESIADFMDTGLDRNEAIRRIRGGMPAQQESNLVQTAQGQPVETQREAISNDSLNEIQAYIDSAVPGLGGKQMLGQYMKTLLSR
ncbi:MAG: hypothetical protein CBD74_05935 [Saprospirales bacterium TMED214]|nr:MAG: hypothetical protein CBD74_05935 [Saprospirales bacterium TMED214]